MIPSLLLSLRWEVSGIQMELVSELAGQVLSLCRKSLLGAGALRDFSCLPRTHIVTGVVEQMTPSKHMPLP